jgi:6-pyruvoyltetrahydropterin/6-carboxytetrahydropterin synthase
LQRLTTIELTKEYLKFSAAHFTIFSATERERLHGHNFAVSAEVTAPVGDNGMCFSYRIFKDKLESLCQGLDEYMLLSGDSPHLHISEQGAQYRVEFNGDEMFFLKSDTLILPVRNATVEEYANYLLERLLEDRELLDHHDVREVVIKVSSGPGQGGNSRWRRDRVGGNR